MSCAASLPASLAHDYQAIVVVCAWEVTLGWYTVGARILNCVRAHDAARPVLGPRLLSSPVLDVDVCHPLPSSTCLGPRPDRNACAASSAASQRNAVESRACWVVRARLRLCANVCCTQRSLARWVGRRWTGYTEKVGWVEQAVRTMLRCDPGGAIRRPRRRRGRCLRRHLPHWVE